MLVSRGATDGFAQGGTVLQKGGARAQFLLKKERYIRGNPHLLGCNLTLTTFPACPKQDSSAGEKFLEWYFATGERGGGGDHS